MCAASSTLARFPLMKMLVFSVSDVWVTLFVRKSVVRIQSAMDVRRAVGAAAGASAEADPASRNRAKEVDQGGIVVLSRCFLQVAGDTNTVPVLVWKFRTPCPFVVIIDLVLI